MSVETRYKNDPQIKAMTDLVDAYQRREVHSAEKILKGMALLLALLTHFMNIVTCRESGYYHGGFFHTWIYR